jgi:hypothetical protein
MVKTAYVRFAARYRCTYIHTSTNGAITKTFFPTIADRKSKKLNMNIKLSTVVTGHGTLRAYYHKFKIINDPVCVYKWDHRPQITHYGNV